MVDDLQKSALHIAVELHDHMDIAHILVQNGADVDWQDDRGLTCLNLATIIPRSKMVDCRW